MMSVADIFISSADFPSPLLSVILYAHTHISPPSKMNIFSWRYNIDIEEMIMDDIVFAKFVPNHSIQKYV